MTLNITVILCVFGIPVYKVQRKPKEYDVCFLFHSDLNKDNRGLKKKKREIEKQLQKKANYKGEQMAKRWDVDNDDGDDNMIVMYHG